MKADLLIMSEKMAAVLESRSGNGRNAIRPRRVEAGEFAGRYAVGVEVLADPENELMMDVFRNLPTVSVDTDEAWPPQEEVD